MLALAILLPLLTLSLASPATSITQHRRGEELVKIRLGSDDSKCVSMQTQSDMSASGNMYGGTLILQTKPCSLGDHWYLTPNVAGPIGRGDNKTRVMESMASGLNGGFNGGSIQLGDAKEGQENQQWLYSDSNKKIVLNPNPNGDTEGKQCLSVIEIVEQVYSEDGLPSGTKKSEFVENQDCLTGDEPENSHYKQDWEIIH